MKTILAIGIAVQAVSAMCFLLYWVTPPFTGSDRGDSKDLITFGSFSVNTVRWDQDVAMFSNVADGVKFEDFRYWHVIGSYPIPLSSGARLYISRLNKYSRERAGYSF